MELTYCKKKGLKKWEKSGIAVSTSTKLLVRHAEGDTVCSSISDGQLGGALNVLDVPQPKVLVALPFGISNKMRNDRMNLMPVIRGEI
jgi:hypothetical protein